MKEIMKPSFPCCHGFKGHRDQQYSMDKGTDSQNYKAVTLYDPSTLAVKFNFQIEFNNIHVTSMHIKTVF